MRPRFRRSPTSSSVSARLAALAPVPLLSAIAGAGWHFSTVLLRPDRTVEYPERLVRVRDGRCWFVRTRCTEQPGDWGLRWVDGPGERWSTVGAPVDDRDPALVCRPLLGGPAPPDGAPVKFDCALYESDPGVHGLAFREVTVAGPLGACPAWFVPAGGGPFGPDAAADTCADTWVIAVHGRGADRRECLRVLPELHRAGLPVLAISYRNDVEAPASPDARYHLGDTEWRDLQAAVSHARAAGAARVVLYGWSMGGAITGAFLGRSDLAGSVAAVVWDCPVLDWRATLREQATARRLPPALIRVVAAFTKARIGVDLDRFDLLRNPPEVRPPTLLLHGTRDGSVPVGPARALAEAAPGLGWPVRYEEVPGAEHTATWNADPERYRRALAEFLAGALAEHRTGSPDTPGRTCGTDEQVQWHDGVRD